MMFKLNTRLNAAFGLLLAAFITEQSFAQTTSRPVTHFSSAQIDSASSSKRTPDKPGRLLVPGPSKEPFLIVVRMKEGAVEIHEQYDDVAIIRSGHGTLRTGQRAIDTKLTGSAPTREWLGGTIQQPTERPISAGDFVVIPAGLAHQYIPAQGDSLVYFTIKVRQADAGKSKGK